MHTRTHTLAVTHFICGLHNNTLCNSNCTAQDRQATSEILTGNHEEGSGHGLTSGTTPTNQNSAVNTVNGHGLTSGTTPTNQDSAVNTVTGLLAG